MSYLKTEIYLDAKDLVMENQPIKLILDPILSSTQKKEESFINNEIIFNKILGKIQL